MPDDPVELARPEPHEAAKQLREAALKLGASRVGICRAEPVPRSERLLEWLDRGFHGSMSWMERGTERRGDPRRLLPGARSVLVIAVDHEVPAEPDRPVAAYAVGLDYHDVLGRILKALRHIVRRLGGEARAYVDTGPLLERELAMQAGIGFIGKNTNLIAKRAGSYFLIGELLTTLELSYDSPARAHCGTCTRCLDLCPTDAFPEPWVLDSNRCISYLTIEHRGDIDRSLRAPMGTHVFGCDVCQQVCPWNRKSDRVVHPELSRQRPDPEAREVLSLDQEGFRKRYRKTAVWRAHLEGLARNVCIALGNTRREAPELAGALEHETASTRRHALWAVGRRARRRGRLRRTPLE